MLLLFAGILYTSFVCWSWGLGAWKWLQQISKGSSMGLLSFPEQSFIGFIFITALGAVANFWIPLGGWYQQLFLFVMALLFCWQYNGFSLLKTELGLYVKMKWTAKLLLLIAAGWILIMGSWKIIHPDSLAYHFPLIRWSAEHIVTPGLANLHIRFGYQSNWFVGAAIFDPGFMGINSISFINGALLIWFVAFCVKRLYAYALYEQEKGGKILWIALLFISGWAFTQFRLTASSASPDFIAAIFIWYIFYLVLHSSNHPIYRLVIAILILFSFTIKLSSAPLFILLTFLLLENKALLIRKHFLTFAIIVLFISGPFLLRNHISSGYLLFPSSLVHVGASDWKVPIDKVDQEAAYVKAYARIQSEGDMESIQEANNASLLNWLPEWLSLRSEAEISILILTLVLVIIGLLHFKIIRKMPLPYQILLLTGITGLGLWFMMAPDPRFGWGFLIGLMALLLYPLSLPEFMKRNEKLLIDTGLYILLAFGAAYFVYRVYNYSTPETWIKPAGVVEQSFRVQNVGSMELRIPIPENGCGNSAQPCTYDSIPLVELRGKNPEDGFRFKENH